MATQGEISNEQYDFESQSFYSDDSDKFHSLEVRHGFIRKVYGILLLQIAATTAIGLAFSYTPVLLNFTVQNPFLVTLLPSLIAFCVLLVLVCNRDLGRRYPTNYICLGLFTVFESLALGGTCAITSKMTGTGNTVLMAFCITSVIFAGLTLFAFQTSYDFTSLVGVMYYVLLGLIAVGFVKIFFPKSTGFELFYGGIGALVFSIYIVIDTQLIIGRRKLKISEEDYIFAALELYLDFVNLFLYILEILRALRSSNN